MDNGSLERRLDRIEQTQTAMLVQMTAHTERLDALNGSVADMAAEIGGAPAHESRGTRPPLRDRLHDVEAAASPVTIEAAFTRVLAKRRAAIWKQWQLRVTLAGVVIGTLFTVLRFAGLGG